MTAAVDIIMRTKDRPILVERALRSIAGQVFTNWRIIAVNDGGDRAVLDEVIARAGLRDRVEVVHHESSRGRTTWIRYDMRS